MIGGHSRKTLPWTRRARLEFIPRHKKCYRPTERRKRKLWDPTLLRGSIGEKNDHPTSFVLKNGRHENTAIWAERD